MSRKRIVIETIAAPVFLVLVVLFLRYYGQMHVAVLDAPRVQTVGVPTDAYAVWKDARVHGRVLVLFDRRLNALSVDRIQHPVLDDSLLTTENYVYFAAAKNLIRKVYHIIPDVSWEEVSIELGKWPLVSHSDGVFHLALDEGLPVDIMRSRDLPRLNEPVLMTVNGDYWDAQGFGEILALMANGRLHSDCITVAGPVPNDILRRFRSLHADDL